VSGLDEVEKYPVCPTCNIYPTCYLLSSKIRNFIGVFRPGRSIDGGMYDHPRLEFNSWYMHISTIIENPKIYIERIRCNDCRALYSKWKNKNMFYYIYKRIIKMVEKEEYNARNMWRQTEPNYIFY
jgi:hypothetical protein